MPLSLQPAPPVNKIYWIFWGLFDPQPEVEYDEKPWIVSLESYEKNCPAAYYVLTVVWKVCRSLTISEEKTGKVWAHTASFSTQKMDMYC